MNRLPHLFANNRAWARRMTERDPQFFARLQHRQSPGYLWIGCSDSRVPANEIVGLLPGDLFVHRNVANVVVHSDLNCLSVLQYAIEVLKVEHVIVCGHYGCGGVQAAMQDRRLGLIDNWLRHVQDVAHKHRSRIAGLAEERRFQRLCELNVVEQVLNACRTTIVRNAWAHGEKLAVHGWIYAISDGLLRDLSICVNGPDELARCYEDAVST